MKIKSQIKESLLHILEELSPTMVFTLIILVLGILITRM